MTIHELAEQQMLRNDLDDTAKERIGIANDTLLQLNKYNLERGVYCKMYRAGVDGGAMPTFDVMRCALTPASTYADELLGGCRVCAIGAMFLTMAIRRDYRLADMSKHIDTPSYPAIVASELRYQLREVFSDIQLYRIESAFEGWNEFYGKYDTATEALTAICINLIQNAGAFTL